MQGYLSTTDGNGKVEINGRTAVYRDPERGHAVVVETDGHEIALDIADVTVSRRSGDGAPVAFEPAPSSIKVINNGNSNGVTVVADGRTEDVPEGRMTTVERNATVSIGIEAELELVVERATNVTNVYHDGSGDVVTGDVTNVDRSTTVNDSVVNRSDVGAAGAEDDADGTDESSPVTVDDSVVNRSSVGRDGEAESRDRSDTGGKNGAVDARTQSVCDDHGPYRGSACLQCADREPMDAAGTSPGEVSERSRDEATDDANADSDPDGSEGSKFCIFCGEDISADATFCPACGEELH